MSVVAGRWQRLAHIGLDRMLGYGLKSSEAFEVTHFGLVGSTRETRPS